MSDGLAAAREALGGERVWLVGGAIRDRILGREVDDLDLIVDGEAGGAARRLGRAIGGPAFALSEEFGAWRVIAPGGAWRADLTPLQGGSLEADLALRDFTVNAIAEPLAGGAPVDPFGGGADLEARRLRMVSPRAFADDPLRALRLPRFACELGMEPEEATINAARAHAGAVAGVAQERVFAELRRIVCAPAALEGLALMDSIGLTKSVLPELAALRGVEQSRYHHLDVYDHTLEVLAETAALVRDPAAVFGPEHGARVADLLAEPLADGLTRGEALRFGALLHDAAKPATRDVTPEGRITFLGHDREGAALARAVLRRLKASDRLQGFVAALTLHHLRLGFLVHERPLSRRAVYRYLTTCEPVEVEVTLLSVADRLATRGRKADAAIAEHLDLAREMLDEALRWREEGLPEPLIRGDDLARELGIEPGPELGRLLGEIVEARFAGEVATREEAVALARTLLTG